MEKSAVIRNFSRYAHTYDSYADIQRRAATDLMGCIGCNGFRRILEIGCGTGNYTLLLKDKFAKAKLRAIDISPEMIKVASLKFRRGALDFSVADAEKLNLGRDYDLITSNACFQWFEDFKSALRKYAGALSSGGCLAFSIFGAQTFKELKESLRVFGFSNNGANFMLQGELNSALKENFKKVEIREVNYEETFSSLKGLLEKIKYTGVRGGGLENKAVFTAATMKKIEECYLDKFRKIKATYQVFYCKGMK